LKILLTGKRGQIGSALLVTLPRLGELIAVDRSQLDLTKLDSVRDTVRKVRPHVIVNAAGYTAVDEAERERVAAFRVNRDGPATLAEEALRLGALLVHFSTDYVFDGHKRVPYVETDSTNPLNAYGRSKLAGEEAILGIGCRHLILRTSWVYAERGKNFLVTIRRLVDHGKELRVVDDQWGAPTSAGMIATAVPSAVERIVADESLVGLYHMTAAGSTTWCRFARSIVGKDVTAISSDAYQTAARRPLYSVLDNTKLNMRLNVRLASWEEGLKETLKK
jgi:dTDP-4-dehydrorhamnose reductase